MRNAGLEETQARIKIGGRNINNLRYTDDITLMAEKTQKDGRCCCGGCAVLKLQMCGSGVTLKRYLTSKTKG